MTAIVLASGSPYRSTLLKKLRLEFDTYNSAVDETPQAGESPADLSVRLAITKARAAATEFPDHLIIGSDQVAAVENCLLGKPGNHQNAIRQLHRQSGKVVRFHTSLCVLHSASGRYLTDMDICDVHFRTLTAAQIHRYVDAERPFDCAGSFKSEGLGIALFNRIAGDDPNALIGLPLIKLVTLLDHFGVAIP